MRFRCVLILVVIVCALSAQNQDTGTVRSPASLLPARTALYVELRQPGTTLKELSGLLQGSCLADYPSGLQRLKQQGDISEVFECTGLLLTPEGLKDAQKFEGLALAILGPIADGGVEYVALLQPGESTSPGLLLRRYLADSDVQAAADVEGVKVYRHTSFSASGAGNAAARMQAMMMQQMPRMAPQGQFPGAGMPTGAIETDIALLPGLIVIGSPAAVKETIAAAKSKGTGPRLAEDPAFQQASKTFGDRSGVFLHANLKGLAAAMEKLEADKRPGWAGLLDPAALPSASGGVTLVDGTVYFRFTSASAGELKSPLLQSLPTTAFKPELLHFVPTNMEAVVGLANPEGSKRWERVLELADAVIKASDANTRLPSRQVDRLEDDLKIKIGPDVAAKITQLVVAQGPAKSSGANGPLLIVLETSDEDAAKSLVTDGLPKVLAALLGQRVVPTVKEVGGRALHVADLGSRGTWSFSRQGNVIAVSSDTDLTSAALTAGEKKQGALADARIAAGLKATATAGLVLIARPAMLAGLARGESPFGPMNIGRTVTQAPGAPFAIQIAVGGGLGGPAPAQPPPLPPAPGQPAGRVADPAGDKKVEDALPPLVLGLTRKGDQIVIEGRLLEPKVSLAKLVDRIIEPPAAGPAVPAVPGFLQGQIQLPPFPAGGLPPAKAVPVPGQPLPAPPK